MTCLFYLVKFPAFKTVYYCLLIFSLVGINTFTQAQWEDANNGLNGGIIRSTAASADGSTIIAGVPNFGVYKSTDNGANWSVINNGLTSKQVYAVAINGTTLFAGMNGGDGVFKSTNGGLSWTQSGLNTQNLNCFTIKGSDIYAGTFNGVFKSSDNGANWTAVDNGLNGTILSLYSTSTFLFAGKANEGLYRSADNGASWVPVTTGFPSFTSVYSLVQNGTDLYAGTYASGIYKSVDNGLNWANVKNFNPAVVWVFSLAVSGTKVIAGSTHGIFTTSDNGANWMASNTGLLNSAVNVLTVAGSNLFASTEGGAVYKSTDSGVNWAVSKAGIKNADIIFLTPVGTDFFAGTNGAGLFKSTDTGQNWTEVNTGLTTPISRALLAASGKHFLATPLGVYVSTNEGLSWNITQLSGIDVSSLVIKGTDIYAGSTTGVYKSTDNGVNWSLVSTGLTNLNVRALAASATQLFAGTEGGVFVSTNNGSSWSAFNTGLSGFSLNIHSLLLKGTDLFAGTQNNGVFKSPNNSASWANSNFPDGWVKNIVEIDGNIFVPTSNTVWTSSDNGANWSRPDDFSAGLAAFFNNVAGVDGKLFLATNLLGVLVRPLNDYFPPQISSFAPTTGGAGTTITITGTFLSGVTSVSFGGTNATSFTVVSPTTIEAVVGAGTSGSVSVTAPSGTASLAGFTFIPAPVVSSFSPLTAGSGATVTINGSNFTGATEVSFGGTPASSFQVLDAITITAVVGAGQSGSVAVTTPGGTGTRTGFSFIGPPTITSFNPTSAPIGATITITGTNFSTTAANNTVKFAGTTATISGTPTTTSIVTSVPQGATTGKISVQVGGETVISDTDFIVSLPTAPTFTDFSPSSGSVGTLVTLTGTNFSTTAANNIVKFNGIAATITGTPTTTNIVTSVPTGATTGKITIEVGGVTTTSANDYTVSATVSDVDGNIYNTIILGNQVWMGENLQTTKYNDGSSIPLITDNSLWLAAIGPAYSWYNNDQATHGNTYGALYNWYVVDVGSNGGKNVCPTGWHVPSDAEFTTLQSYLIANGFNYDGTTSGNKIGKAMAATTTWLANGTTGAVGNNDFPLYRNKTGFTASSAGYRSISAAGAFSGLQNATNWWTTNTPNFANGSYWRLILDNVDFSKFDVLRGEGNSIRCVKDLASSGPAIGSFTPNSGPIGTSVTITGTNFSAVAANNIVKFNGVTATISGTPTTTSIVTSVPTGATTGKITVDVGGEIATSAADFTVTSPTAPTLTGMNPTSGPIGTAVTLTGTNFSTTVANNIIKFNGVTATITGTPTTTSIVTSVPTGATTGKITVDVGGEIATSATDFTVTSISTPTISGFNPVSGTIGTAVTITGTNFSSTAANNIVRFNGTTATITGTPTATSIVTAVPSGATTGKITVQVGSETATSATDFVVNSSSTPTISGFNPSKGVVGTSVTISGTNFSTTSANNLVKFNGISATITGTPTATSLVVTVPAGAVSGKVTVTVNGETVTSATNFLVDVVDNGLTIPYSSFGSAIQNYRIIAIPLNLTSNSPASIFDELGTANKSNWRLQRYSGGTTRDHTSALNPGEGYWLIVRENPGVEIKTGPGTLVTAPFESGFPITLSPGWNQIGNPYNFTINWSQVTSANPGLSTTLRKYDGSFINATTLAAMEGGFINNTGSSSQTIIIPLNSGGATRQAEIVRNALNQDNWQLELVAEQGNAKNLISGLGMHKNASSEMDAYDGLNMPTFFDQSLELKHSKNINNESLSSDIVPTEDAHTWEFEVVTTYPEEYITLRWDNSYFGVNNRALVLWDVALQLPVDMRLKNSYTFSKSVSKNFKVLFGDASKVQSELLASDLVFHSLSPNPAAESVTLHFSLPVAGTVLLEAMDVMGKVVWSIEKHLEAGYHEQRWDRSTERAGVYLIQVKTKTTSQQRRVVFEK